MRDVDLERARALIRPWAGRSGVIGIYLVGSATRPFCDELSDLDLEVVVEDDAYAATPDEERHVFVVDEGPPKRVDHEFYLRAWTDFLALVDSRQDIVRAGYRHAVVLHDPDGRVAPVVERLAALRDDVRDARLRVHWLEFLFGIGRSRKTFDRGRTFETRLVLADALRAAVKLLFVAAGAWPAPTHWTRDELSLLGVGEPLLDHLETCTTSLDGEDWKALTVAVVAHLEASGHTFHEDAEALVRWAYLTADGRAALERWGSS